METLQFPWLFAFLTAAWFGWMAKRAGRSITLWAVGGAAFGLVVSTLVLGLGRASSIAFSDNERAAQQTKWLVVAAVIILIVGWLLTSSLHRLHDVILRKFNPEPGPTEVAPTAGKSSSTPVAKPSPGKS